MVEAEADADATAEAEAEAEADATAEETAGAITEAVISYRNTHSLRPANARGKKKRTEKVQVHYQGGHY